MGHLFFLGFLLWIVILVVLRLSLGYLRAKRKKVNDPPMPIEIPAEGRLFHPRQYVGYASLLLALAFPGMSIYGCVHLWHKETPDAVIIFWLLADSILPVTLLFSAVAVQGFRSYLFIDPNGFEYREFGKPKRYPREDIEGVYRDSEFKIGRASCRARVYI